MYLGRHDRVGGDRELAGLVVAVGGRVPVRPVGNPVTAGPVWLVSSPLGL